MSVDKVNSRESARVEQMRSEEVAEERRKRAESEDREVPDAPRKTENGRGETIDISA